MFSGIIENFGIVKEFKKYKDYKLVIESNLKFKDVKKGSSVSCNGVCLTVTKKIRKPKKIILYFDVSSETVKCSNFDQIKIGDKINIEKSLKLGDEISGHFVFGHVDDTAKLVSSKEVGDSFQLTFKVSNKIIRYLARKGSVSLNGISLTINNITKNNFSVNIVPYTWKKTNLSKIKIGDRINLEVDMLARYVTQNL